ncbi:hypothetical protein UFOVP455_19 [uncultured Caudovirales phage]|uniref:Uncharacterized protein n=1 Tax=uncultured Caudovirales phage TaxID=2100421 RepID=A0A6J5MFJ6_9CAUD|nr:hypothetical protein UFOVP455_19 [uncultured Caudovirales phage]
MKFNKIWVGTEHKYGIDHKISDGILTVIYDTCYSVYQLSDDKLNWLLLSENNDLGELIQSLEVSASDLLEFSGIDVNSDYDFLNSDSIEDFENAIKDAVIKAYSALWENQVNNPYKDSNLELLNLLRESEYFDFDFMFNRSILRARFSHFNLI